MKRRKLYLFVVFFWCFCSVCSWSDDGVENLSDLQLIQKSREIWIQQTALTQTLLSSLKKAKQTIHLLQTKPLDFDLILNDYALKIDHLLNYSDKQGQRLQTAQNSANSLQQALNQANDTLTNYEKDTKKRIRNNFLYGMVAGVGTAVVVAGVIIIIEKIKSIEDEE